MRDLEKIMKAFANKRRLAIIAYLKKNEEASVAQIAKGIGLSFKATSKHLGILGAADILDKEQRSLLVFYRISNNLKPISKQVVSFL